VESLHWRHYDSVGYRILDAKREQQIATSGIKRV
jgi:hypothetical protein